MANILIICKANSCRSQMAEAFLRQIDNTLNVCSAGIVPAVEIHPFTIKVMQEIGIDLSSYKTTDIAEFVNHKWDVVITVCDFADENCPIEIKKAKKRFHCRFPDPVAYRGSEDAKLQVFREVRDQIKDKMVEMYQDL